MGKRKHLSQAFLQLSLDCSSKTPNYDSMSNDQCFRYRDLLGDIVAAQVESSDGNSVSNADLKIIEILLRRRLANLLAEF